MAKSLNRPARLFGDSDEERDCGVNIKNLHGVLSRIGIFPLGLRERRGFNLSTGKRKTCLRGVRHAREIDQFAWISLTTSLRLAQDLFSPQYSDEFEWVFVEQDCETTAYGST